MVPQWSTKSVSTPSTRTNVLLQIHVRCEGRNEPDVGHGPQECGFGQGDGRTSPCKPLCPQEFFEGVHSVAINTKDSYYRKSCIPQLVPLWLRPHGRRILFQTLIYECKRDMLHLTSTRNGCKRRSDYMHANVFINGNRGCLTIGLQKLKRSYIVSLLEQWLRIPL